MSVPENDKLAHSEDSDSEGCEMISEEDNESVNNVTCRDLAWLNVNSNGRTTRDGSRSDNESVTETSNNDKKRLVKQFSTGQTSFEPVGLSLSSSGVQLYMMVSSEDKEKLLSSTKSATRRKEGKKATSGKNEFEDEANLSMNTSWTNVNGAKDNQNASSHSDSQRIVIQASRIGFHSIDEPLQAGLSSRLPVASDGSKRTFVCKNAEVMPQSPCHPKSKLTCGDRGCAEGHSMMAGPCWRFESDEINASSTEDYLRISSPRDERVECRHRCPHIDSKEKHFVRNACDTVKRHVNDQYPDISQDKRAKRHHVVYNGSPIGYSQSHYANSSSDEDDCMPSQEEHYSRGIREIKKRMTTKHTTPRKMYPQVHSRTMHEPNMADGRIMTEHADSHSVNRAVAEATSLTTVFNNSRHNSSMDSVTIARFTEYTENMRKNIKQDYKNLSSLMKSFSDVVQERNNNQSSQSSSDFIQFEKSHKDNDRCSVM